MNWYKESQQNLLFYPWKDHPANVVEEAKPSYVDKETGQEYYKCIICGDEKPSSDIVDFYKGDELRRYNYPIHNLDHDTILNTLVKLRNLFNPYYKMFSEVKLAGEAEAERINALPENKDVNYWNREVWRDNTYIVDAPDIAQICNSPEIINYTQYVRNSGHWAGYGYNISPRFLNIFAEIGENGKIDGNQLEFVNSNFYSFDIMFQEIPDFSSIEKREIKVTVKSPVCSECNENAAACTSCDQAIYPGQTSYETVGGGKYACEKCIDNGAMNICSECGLAEYSDNMEYGDKGDDNGPYCSDCYKKMQTNYEDTYQDKIEEIARKRGSHPFDPWFSENNREYLPFETGGKLSSSDKNVIDNINGTMIDGEECHTDLTNYQNGFAFCGKRKYRIGKLFDRMLRDRFSRIDSWGNNESEEETKHKEEAKKSAKNEISNLKREFETSKFRAVKSTVSNNLMVVISKDPNDIGKMSTDRNWTSCMNLGKPDGRKNDVYAEVKDGGIIAYLTQKEDKNIEDPLARLLIRRYENEDGVSIAMPEEKVYGETRDDTSFKNTVQKWIDSKQGSIPKGSYEIRGMPYVDSLQETMLIAKRMFDNLKKLAGKNWYKKSAVCSAND